MTYQLLTTISENRVTRVRERKKEEIGGGGGQ